MPTTKKRPLSKVGGNKVMLYYINAYEQNCVLFTNNFGHQFKITFNDFQEIVDIEDYDLRYESKITNNRLAEICLDYISREEIIEKAKVIRENDFSNHNAYHVAKN